MRYYNRRYERTSDETVDATREGGGVNAGKALPTISFGAGDRVITEGEKDTAFFVLVAGELAVWRGRTELGRLSACGDMVGELAALTGRARSATVVATCPTEMLKVEFDARRMAKTHPEIVGKVDTVITTRYEIARNKTALYVAGIAVARRALLHQVLVENELSQSRLRRGGETAIRKRIRRLLDDTLAIRGDSDDPRLLRKIADENGATERYLTALAQSPWLDDRLGVRFVEIENRYLLTSRVDQVATLKEKALLATEMLELLADFENLPGLTREMDIINLESIVPFNNRLTILRDVAMKDFRSKNPAADEKQALYHEKKLLAEVEKQKVSAGKDVVFVSRVAEQLGVASVYEKELRRLIALSDTSGTFLELPPL